MPRFVFDYNDIDIISKYRVVKQVQEIGCVRRKICILIKDQRYANGFEFRHIKTSLYLVLCSI